MVVAAIVALLLPGKAVMAPAAVRIAMQLPVTSGLLLHLDASQHGTTETNITNKVTKWSDPQDKKRGAAPPQPDNGATLNANGLNGLPVVDFGPYRSDHWMEFKDAKGGLRKLGNIRSVFWVMRGAGFLLSDDQTADFARGGDEGSPTAGIFGGGAAGPVKTSTLRLNGVVVKPVDTPLPQAFSLVSVVTPGPVTASRLCKDRNGNDRVGGQEIAEVVVYDRALSATEVEQVEAYLRTKWLAPK